MRTHPEHGDELLPYNRMVDIEEARDLFKDLNKLAIEFAPLLAKTYKIQYDALINVGFTNKEALQIVIKIQQAVNVN